MEKHLRDNAQIESEAITAKRAETAERITASPHLDSLIGNVIDEYKDRTDEFIPTDSVDAVAEAMKRF